MHDAAPPSERDTIAVANDLPPIVDAERLAAGTGQRAEIAHGAVPQEGVVGVIGPREVARTHDLAAFVDIGREISVSTECAEVVHHPVLPEERMDESRLVGDGDAP